MKNSIRTSFLSLAISMVAASTFAVDVIRYSVAPTAGGSLAPETVAAGLNLKADKLPPHTIVQFEYLKAATHDPLAGPAEVLFLYHKKGKQLLILPNPEAIKEDGIMSVSRIHLGQPIDVQKGENPARIVLRGEAIAQLRDMLSQKQDGRAFERLTAHKGGSVVESLPKPEPEAEPAAAQLPDGPVPVGQAFGLLHKSVSTKAREYLATLGDLTAEQRAAAMEYIASKVEIDPAFQADPVGSVKTWLKAKRQQVADRAAEQARKQTLNVAGAVVEGAGDLIIDTGKAAAQGAGRLAVRGWRSLREKVAQAVQPKDNGNDGHKDNGQE